MSDRRSKNAPVLSERRAPSDDRRTAPRYETRGTAAVIGWSEGEEHRTIAAILVDVSMGGFSAGVEVFPPREVPIWIRLDGVNPSPWLKASVVSTTTKGFLLWTRRLVRACFLDPCTYDFFKTAIEGFTHEYHSSDPQFEGFNKCQWR